MNKDLTKIEELLNELSKKLPKFKDGRIDYSNSNISIVVTVFVKFRDEILLLKRSEKVSTYQGKWNTVAGYIDDFKPIKNKILEELCEETGIKEEDISSINISRTFSFKDNRLNKEWFVQPCVVELKYKPVIKLDWEHVSYQWIKPFELQKFDTVPKLKESLRIIDVLSLR